MNTEPPIEIRPDEVIITPEDPETKTLEEEKLKDENSLGDDISQIVQGRYHIAKNMTQTSGQ